MPIKNVIRTAALGTGLFCNSVFAQTETLPRQAEQAMYKATKFMVDSVSTNGGYVWYYLPDLSRRWGEMEAYKTMVWVQDGGTISVGHMLLDAYKVTGNEYFYQAAEKAAAAMIWGQSNEGGWNYMIDFAGDNSLKKWYATIGKNGWRLEEFQHYYGNNTYDDDVTSDAARFLLRLYLEKLDPKYKPALDKAINFILRSQYPNGGWPQRYPLKNDFKKAGHPDYTSYYTFNDDVIWENVLFLIQCYETLGEQRFLEPINKGMNFYLLAQKNGAWGQQYNMKMEVAGARTYEPTAYLPRTTFNNALILLKFYQYTGDRKFLAHVPDAIQWLEKVQFPESKARAGRYTHPLFVNPVNDKPIYVHRKGSNVTYGHYYTDTSDTKLLSHMQAKGFINIEYLKNEYARVSALSPEEATKDSPLIPGKFESPGTPQSFYHLDRGDQFENEGPVSEARIKELINTLDSRNRWLVKHVSISNPYIGDGQNKELTDEYASVNAGDKTDTSPYRDLSDQEYISTPAYIRNMHVLINYLRSIKKTSITWHLKDTRQIGKFSPIVLGNPVVKAEGNDSSIYFNGTNDGLVVPAIPIEGWSTFTVEVLFKPDSDGPVAPRFIHFEDTALNRGTFELRLTKNDQWYFDGFLKNGKLNKGVTLIDSTKLHPANRWYWAALVYDGNKMYSYINGQKELEGEIDFPPMTKGNISLGVRLNKVNWFKGQIREMRFHPEALQANNLQHF